MNKPISYKQKNKFLIAGGVVMILAIYLISIRKTIDLYAENTLLEKQNTIAIKAPEELKFYSAEAARLEKILRFSNGPGDIKEDILKTAVAGCENNGVLFKNLLEPSVFSEENIQIETYQVILQGDYINLLKSLVYIEQNLHTGKVVSVKFKLEKNRTDLYVLANIFIQTSNANQ